MEIWDPFATALVTQLINLAVAGLFGVRVRGAGHAAADSADRADGNWLEVRITWRRGGGKGSDGPNDPAW